MGKKTHGPYVIAAIEGNDIQKVSDILSNKFRDKSKVKKFLISEVKRLASAFSEVPLLLAATLTDPTIIEYMVQKHEANINFVYEYGFQKYKKSTTALMTAVKRGLYTTVDAIISSNANVNFQDHKGRSSLHHAIKRADYRMVKLLLSRGAQVTVVDVSENSPLHVATIYGHSELIKLLIKYGGDLYKKGQHGAIPIHMAAREGHNSLIKMFCELYEVNPDIKVPCYDDLEKCSLHVAASQGHAETVLALLDECGVEVNTLDSEGNNPLHYTVLQEYDPLGMKAKDDFTDTVKVLLNKGCEVNIQNGRGETAMHLAARNEFQKVLEVLVLAGCDPLIEDNDKNRPLNLVADDDTVSKQIIKKAIEDRNRIMYEAPKVRAKGFITNFQRGTFATASSHSLSILNMSGVNNQRLHKSYLNNASQNSKGNLSANNAPYSSSNSSKRRSKESLNSGSKIYPLEENPFNYAVSRRVKSVENLDSKRRNKQRHGGKLHEFRSQYLRKNSYQGSEVTSMWSVTPPGSVQDLYSEQNYSAANARTKKSKKFHQGQKTIKESPEFSKKKELQESSGSEDYYLDDEESLDNVLDDHHLSKKRLKANKNDHVDEWMHKQKRYFNKKGGENYSEKSGSSYSSSDSEAVSEIEYSLKPSKPKPVPPPKPTNKKHAYLESAPNIDKVIQLEVDDRDISGQTTIRVIPVSSPRSSRARTSSSEFLNPSSPSHNHDKKHVSKKSKHPAKPFQDLPVEVDAEQSSEKILKPSPRQTNIKNASTKSHNLSPVTESNFSFTSSGQDKSEKGNKEPQKKVGNLVFAKASTQSLDNFQHSNLARISAGEKAVPAKPTYSSAISPILMNTSFDNSSKIIQQMQSKQFVLGTNDSYVDSSLSMQKTENSTSFQNSNEETLDESQGNPGNIHRIISFACSESLPFTLAGGNKAGILIDAIDQESTAFKNGLLRGDRILKINDIKIFGKTKEEVDQVLRDCDDRITLDVCNEIHTFNSINGKGAAGDHYYVKAHFNCDAQKKTDLDVKPGQIFLVTDSMPAGNPGFWRAKLLSPNGEEQAVGLIPNERKAKQLVAKRKLLDESCTSEKSGSLLHGFRRTKSTERNKKGSNMSPGDFSDLDSTLNNSISYERVKLKKVELLRPVVILGLFCDVVINRLVKEYPETFEKPQETVENAQNEEQPVNIGVLKKYGRGKLLLTIFSPPSIQYLQLKTDLFPVVIYLAPVSKIVVKSIKSKLAPTYAKDANYMFDEAVKFQKNYEDLFTLVVNYTADDKWFYYLKDSILNAQSEPVWQPLTLAELENIGLKESLNYFPEDPCERRPLQKNKNSKRISRTTDDLPQHTTHPEDKPRKNAKQDNPSKLNLEPKIKPLAQPRKTVKATYHTHETPL